MLEISRRTLLRHGLAFLAVYFALSGAFIVYGQSIAQALAPVLAVGLDLVQSDFDTLEVVAEEKKLAVTGEMAHDGIAGKTAGGKAITMRTSRAMLAISPVLVLSLVIAFPQRSKKAKLAALSIALPLIVLLMSLQVSAVLRSALTAKLLRKPPSFTTFMMENGGLQVLAVVSALAAVWLGGLLAQRASALASRRASALDSRQQASAAPEPSAPAQTALASAAKKPQRAKPLKPARGRAR